MLKLETYYHKFELDYDYRVKISEICSELDVDGLRGDLVTNRAAKALAAFEGHTTVTPDDIYRIIPLMFTSSFT